MKKKLRSVFPVGSTTWALRKAQWRSLGLSDADLEKPKIAIVNTSSELSSCFSHLDGFSSIVKQSVRNAGGVPFEIRTTAPSDFITSSGLSGRYLMPSRDLIINDIEVAVEGAQLDGMICLSSCDKTAPAHLMAAGRLNIPAFILPCGYQQCGKLAGKSVDIEDVFESVGGVSSGRITQEHLSSMCEVAVGSPGVCTGMGTANSMHIVSEALGMAPAGATPAAAVGNKLAELLKTSGDIIIRLVEEDIRPRDIITDDSVRNALIVSLAVSGSLNVARHLQGVAVETGLSISIYDTLETLRDHVPVLTAVKPNGETRIDQFEAAGGTREVIRQLAPLLNRDVITIDGKSQNIPLSEKDGNEEKQSIIGTLEAPISEGPSLLLVRGNIAVDGALIKIGTRSLSEFSFTGEAVIFESQEDALEGLRDGKVRSGNVVVLRGLGPVGGPGVASASWFVAALHGAGLGESVAVITDGQLSGLNHGIVVGQVMPEAATGGALGLIYDGDTIEIDAVKQYINLKVSDAELANRPNTCPIAPLPTDRGWLHHYRHLVASLREGAVLKNQGSSLSVSPSKK
nr:dihydroxy-acid dehydratase [Halomonas socia]